LQRNLDISTSALVEKTLARSFRIASHVVDGELGYKFGKLSFAIGESTGAAKLILIILNFLLETETTCSLCYLLYVVCSLICSASWDASGQAGFY